jgi:hypothetical protein
MRRLSGDAARDHNSALVGSGGSLRHVIVDRCHVGGDSGACHIEAGSRILSSLPAVAVDGAVKSARALLLGDGAAKLTVLDIQLVAAGK